MFPSENEQEPSQETVQQRENRESAGDPLQQRSRRKVVAEQGAEAGKHGQQRRSDCEDSEAAEKKPQRSKHALGKPGPRGDGKHRRVESDREPFLSDERDQQRDHGKQVELAQRLARVGEFLPLPPSAQEEKEQDQQKEEQETAHG